MWLMLVRMPVKERYSISTVGLAGYWALDDGEMALEESGRAITMLMTDIGNGTALRVSSLLSGQCWV